MVSHIQPVRDGSGISLIRILSRADISRSFCIGSAYKIRRGTCYLLRLRSAQNITEGTSLALVWVFGSVPIIISGFGFESLFAVG